MIEYSYKGARALVILHEESLRRFLSVWEEARKQEVGLPSTDDPTYASYKTLLFHVLKWSREYMVWMCEKLGLPDPGIRLPPDVERLVNEADDYVEHLLENWQTPLASVPTDAFSSQVFVSRWGVEYCIDAMLEHAVLHPERHRFQLKELMREASGQT